MGKIKMKRCETCERGNVQAFTNCLNFSNIANSSGINNIQSKRLQIKHQHIWC